MEYLKCIYCDREFKDKERFIAHIKDNGNIDCAICLNCYDTQPEQVKYAEAKQGGWVALERDWKEDYKLLE